MSLAFNFIIVIAHLGNFTNDFAITPERRNLEVYFWHALTGCPAAKDKRPPVRQIFNILNPDSEGKMLGISVYVATSKCLDFESSISAKMLSLIK